MAPKSIQEIFDKAARLAKSGDLNGATKQFQLILKKNPKVAEAHYHLGQIAIRQNRLKEAVSHLNTANKLRPDQPAVLDAYANALHLIGKDDLALKVYDKLISVKPDLPKPLADKALLLQRLGQFDDADNVLRQAIDKHPLDGELYRILVSTKKLTKDDPLLDQMSSAWESIKLTGQGRVHLGYAYAKVMEDTGQYGDVFKYLNPANAQLTKTFPYDLKAREAEIETLMRAFRTWAPPEVPKAPQDQIIFITGMPRSGTTLVEQILASHSDVTGGGELAIALRHAYDTLHFSEGGHVLDALKPNAIADLGVSYLKELQARVGKHKVTTDKSIQTYMVMGLMHLALPNAKFVLVRRDPRDIGLSIYKNYFFAGKHRYGNDLRVIGQYIALYEKMIAFWKERIPDQIIEVHYEDLIANAEQQTRRLVAACGLKWEDACLSFHETKREVKTLSLHQVRQPIYASSAKAWQRYEKELAPLIEALEESGCL